MSSPAPLDPSSNAAAKPSNFLRQIIESDLAKGTHAQARWGGTPGDAAHHAGGQPDPAKIRTRFPPEPNGYLHVGHAKSICLNFGLAADYGGVCHLRFDDTNPEKEDQEYVDAIIDAVHWLGFDWKASGDGADHLYYASNYFDFMYRAAEYLIENGKAYVDEQTPDEMRANRGDFGKPGVDSPFRSRTVAENLARFREMREGKLPDGAAVLRAKIDMASPNINLRDPAIYRIKHAEHHNTGNQWCIYPMYTFAHPIEDALEHITHSICTLEFEDQRPFYDWLMDRLVEGGLIAAPQPRQYEFARLNLTYVVTSKRKLKHLVDNGIVTGWDDPRMPTIVGLRRRGYTPESIRLFCERIGVTKDYSWIDYSTLEGCLREDLEAKAHRGMAVLNPVKLVLTNWDEVMGAGHLEPCSLPALPHPPEGTESPLRHFTIGKAVWIEREDFEEVPPKGYKRLFPGNKVRLKGGYVIECTGCNKDADGRITEVLATVVPDTKSGTPGADTVKVKAAITWVGVADGVKAEVRMYDRLFTDAQPDAGGKDFLTLLNPDSLKVVTAIVEPSLANARPGDQFQFERHGYFVADSKDHAAGKPVFNLAVGLKDSWGK
ncbi:glutamine--tRNA ligase/YqeY domain fusion protein [Acidovorax sp. SUPP2522]|uniref:glutamine--tRNA ligase/YqeY domain fusion protein n=1 Tax=unclassified Acidovorax TaxID=2684926 RepID=UPI002348EF2F|nr:MULTISPECIES: glutamine--tRNA ligase/YqeY domain fusion protein [Comamonadaceae]WCM95839.1 glutamine--tRNA ligase/YqeY domain fusion protein [Acidovorax sp. GBBC 1281]WOI44694.1 glutamine--tRNA ligase/YqeY domain fusion protein [Paracidovorax avenae]GKT14602.1 glutamine--tRNA ligase/YqeY domain fusion protein [Acidovorax sp. SUPP2522]